MKPEWIEKLKSESVAQLAKRGSMTSDRSACVILL
jgi:hypothetical protein